MKIMDWAKNTTVDRWMDCSVDGTWYKSDK